MSYAGGTGTELDPYLIATRDHLLNIALNIGSHFALISDIDCGAGPTNDIDFGGSVLDGRGHKIYNVFAPRLTVTPLAGLFASIEAGGIVRRVHVDAAMSATGTGQFHGMLCRYIRGGVVEDVLQATTFRATYDGDPALCESSFKAESRLYSLLTANGNPAMDSGGNRTFSVDLLNAWDRSGEIPGNGIPSSPVTVFPQDGDSIRILVGREIVSELTNRLVRLYWHAK